MLETEDCLNCSVCRSTYEGCTLEAGVPERTEQFQRAYESEGSIKNVYFLSVQEEFFALQHRTTIIYAYTIKLNGYFIVLILFFLSAIFKAVGHIFITIKLSSFGFPNSILL